MALRGIDGRREGVQKSIKNEKGEIKSSPSHHLLKWVYSLPVSALLEQPCSVCDHSHVYCFRTHPSSFVFLFPSPVLLIDACPQVSLPFQPKGLSHHQMNGFIDISEYHKVAINGVTELKEFPGGGGRWRWMERKKWWKGEKRPKLHKYCVALWREKWMRKRNAEHYSFTSKKWTTTFGWSLGCVCPPTYTPVYIHPLSTQSRRCLCFMGPCRTGIFYRLTGLWKPLV